MRQMRGVKKHALWVYPRAGSEPEPLRRIRVQPPNVRRDRSYATWVPSYDCGALLRRRAILKAGHNRDFEEVSGSRGSKAPTPLSSTCWLSGSRYYHQLNAGSSVARKAGSAKRSECRDMGRWYPARDPMRESGMASPRAPRYRRPPHHVQISRLGLGESNCQTIVL